VLRTFQHWKELLASLVPDAGIMQWHKTWVLKNGSNSPIYADWRRLRGHPRARYAAIWCAIMCMKELGITREFDFDLIADIPTGVTPVVANIAYELGIPQVTPHPPKDHGTGTTIEGIYQPGQRVVVWDDVATSGGSIITGIQILSDEGLDVLKDVFVMMDREQGAADKLAEKGYILHSVFTADSLLNYFNEHGQIEPEKFAELMAYLHPGQGAQTTADAAATRTVTV